MADATQGDGIWKRCDVLATPQGLAENGRVASPVPVIAEPASEDRQVGLVEGFFGLGDHPG